VYVCERVREKGEGGSKSKRKRERKNCIIDWGLKIAIRKEGGGGETYAYVCMVQSEE